MKKKTVFVLILLALAAACFITCDNPILETWWQEEKDNKNAEPDYDYVAIIKDVPHLIYETIIQEKIIYETIIAEIPVIVQEYVYIDRPLPPEVLLQHIDIIGIEFIIFSGESIKYNAGPGRFGDQTIDGHTNWINGSTDLTSSERTTNNKIVYDMAKELYDNPGDPNDPAKYKYFLILHGHSNPVLRTPLEQISLEYISTERAKDVARMINKAYFAEMDTPPQVWVSSPINDTDDPGTVTGDTPLYLENVEKRLTTRGYGGGRNLSSPNSTYAGLNRRVEAILFTIKTDPVNSPGVPPGGTEY